MTQGQVLSKGYENKVVQLGVTELWDQAGAHQAAPKEHGKGMDVTGR